MGFLKNIKVSLQATGTAAFLSILVICITLIAILATAHWPIQALASLPQPLGSRLRRSEETDKRDELASAAPRVAGVYHAAALLPISDSCAKLELVGVPPTNEVSRGLARACASREHFAKLSINYGEPGARSCSA